MCQIVTYSILLKVWGTVPDCGGPLVGRQGPQAIMEHCQRARHEGLWIAQESGSGGLWEGGLLRETGQARNEFCRTSPNLFAGLEGNEGAETGWFRGDLRMVLTHMCWVHRHSDSLMAISLLWQTLYLIMKADMILPAPDIGNLQLTLVSLWVLVPFSSLCQCTVGPSYTPFWIYPNEAHITLTPETHKNDIFIYIKKTRTKLLLFSSHWV